MKQKRAILLILALMMLVSCAACGTAEDRSEAILQAAQQATTLPAPSDMMPVDVGRTLRWRKQPLPKSKPQTDKATDKPVQSAKTQPEKTKMPATQAPQKSGKIKVKITIDCKTAVVKDENIKHKFGSGMMASKTVEVDQGATVYDVLKKAASHVGASGGYVYNINGLSEGDCGSGSGWMYSLNGKYVQKGCKQQKVSDGDVVKWRYTTDKGKDLGASKSGG
ncbi:MAG: DUF4430 domain-containing protein [Christensenellales bacterium]